MASLFQFAVSTVAIRAALLEKHLSGRQIAESIATSAEATVVPYARRLVRMNKSVFEGNLFKSLSARVRYTAMAYKVDIGTIGVFYGLNIEKGTPAGSIPVDSKLIRWARIKAQSKNPAALARAIAKSVARKGIKAKPFLLPAYEATKGAFLADSVSRIKSGLRRV